MRIGSAKTKPADTGYATTFFMPGAERRLHDDWKRVERDVRVRQTPVSLTATDASGQRHEVLRSHVASMTASANSLMPNELEREMSEQDLSDLIAYLKNGLRSPAAGGAR